MQKAVSPLIATLLLIAVALVIAGILYVWSSTYFNQQTESFNTTTVAQTECAFAGVNIEDSSTAANACDFNKSDRTNNYSIGALDANKLSFKLSNTGTYDLTQDFTIIIDDGNRVVTAAYLGDLAKGTFAIVQCNDASTSGTTGCVRTSTTTFRELALGSTIKSVRIVPTQCPSKYDETTRCTTSTS